MEISPFAWVVYEGLAFAILARIEKLVKTCGIRASFSVFKLTFLGKDAYITNA